MARVNIRLPNRASRNGRKIIDGTMQEIRSRFSEQSGDANLEEIFFRATSDAKSEPPVIPDTQKT